MGNFLIPKFLESETEAGSFSLLVDFYHFTRRIPLMNIHGYICNKTLRNMLYANLRKLFKGKVKKGKEGKKENVVLILFFSFQEDG